MRETTLLTIEGFKDKLDTDRGSDTPVCQIWEYGRDGFIQFVVVHQNRKKYKLVEAWKAEPRSLLSKFFPITPNQLSNILDTDIPIRIALVEMLVEGKLTTFVPDPYADCGRENLRVTGEEADRFIRWLDQRGKEPAGSRSKVSELTDKRLEYVKRFLSKRGVEDLTDHSRESLLDLFKQEEPDLFRTLSQKSFGNFLGQCRKHGIAFPTLKHGS